MLLMIGGCLMMLEPVLRRPAKIGTGYVGAALREAFLPPSAAPHALEQLLERMP